MIEPVERRTKKVKSRTTPSIIASTPADDAVSVVAFAAAGAAAAAADLAATGFATNAPLAFTHVCSSPNMVDCLSVEPAGHEGAGPNNPTDGCPASGVGLFAAKKALRAASSSSTVSYIFPLNSPRFAFDANLFLVSSGCSDAKNWTGAAGAAVAADVVAIFAYSLRR
jgi:hypothetical protein